MAINARCILLDTVAMKGLSEAVSTRPGQFRYYRYWNVWVLKSTADAYTGIDCAITSMNWRR